MPILPLYSVCRASLLVHFVQVANHITKFIEILSKLFIIYLKGMVAIFLKRVLNLYIKIKIIFRRG